MNPSIKGAPRTLLAPMTQYIEATETKIFWSSKVKTLTKICQICLDLHHLDNRFSNFPGEDPLTPMVIHSMNLAIEGPLEIAVGHWIFKSSGLIGH